MGSRGPTRLGDLAEQGLWLRADCRRCGHARVVRPDALFRRASPALPWRWLRFRCRCGARQVAVRVGLPDHLRKGVQPLYSRPELLDLIAGAVRRHMTYLDQSAAQAIAHTVLRGMMAAGFDVRPAETDDAE